MKVNAVKLVAGVLAAACLGCAAPARAFWTDGGRKGGALEQLGIEADVNGIGMPPPGPAVLPAAADRAFPGAAPAAGDALPWAFFDLGKTLISHTPQYTDMKYIPGAREYLRDLKSRGFHLGMLINWPEEEGSGDAEKLELLKGFLAGGWSDGAPFDWAVFEAVLFPPRNVFRKPHPYLFLRALKTAAPGGAVYQVEDRAEMAAAEKAGLPAHRVVFFPGPGEKTVSWLSAEEIMTLARGAGRRGQDRK